MLRAIARLNRLLASLAGLCLLAMMLVGGLDVLATNLDALGLQSRPLPSAREFVATMLVAAVFLAMALAQQRRAHIQVGFGRLTGGRLALGLEALRHLAHALFYGLIAGFGWSVAVEATRSGEFAPGLINFPMWPARVALAVGATAMAVQCLADLAVLVRSRVRPAED